MTKSGRKVTPPQVYSDAELSDDSQYASLSQEQESTEDEQEIASQKFESSSNGRRILNNNNNHTGNQKTFQRRLPRSGPRSIVSTSSSLDDKQNNIQRKPTRRPDPQIFNRNALMARENRMKKKQHLETLEHDVDSLKQENQSLRKLLKQRSTMVYKLRDERLYLKSIIANKTSIMSLLKTIQGNRIPITSSAMSFVTEHDNHASPGTSSSSSGYLNDEFDGTVRCLIADPMMTVALTHISPPFTDPHFESSNTNNKNASPTHSLSSDCSTASSTTSVCTEMPPLDSWESLLNDDFPADSFLIPQLSDDDEDDAVDQSECNGSTVLKTAVNNNDCQSNVSHEHNYSNNHIIKQTVESTTSSSEQAHSQSGKTGPASSKQHGVVVDQPGICLHLSGGRVSLEFCGSCHRHSMDAWDEEEEL